jgi:hypothetical protein
MFGHPLLAIGPPRRTSRAFVSPRGRVIDLFEELCPSVGYRYLRYRVSKLFQALFEPIKRGIAIFDAIPPSSLALLFSIEVP